MPAKTTFAAAIRQRLNEERLSVRELAERINFPDATVRTWLHRNRFPRDGAVQMAKVLGLSGGPEDLARAYDIGKGWANLRSRLAVPAAGGSLQTAFQFMDRRRDHMAQSLNNALRNIAYLLRSMRTGDLFVLASATVTPLEFEKHVGQQLLEAIAEGVRNGGTYLYVRPTEAIVSRYYESWGLRRVLQVQEMQTEFQDFRRNLAAWLASAAAGQSLDAERLVKARTAQYFCGDSLFWVPGFVIGMFQTADLLGNLGRRMTIRLPTGFGGILYLPPDDLFSWRFGRCIHRALVEQKEALDARREGFEKMPARSRDRRREEEAWRLDEEAYRVIRRLMEAKFIPE